jgi:hypothetical protein
VLYRIDKQFFSYFRHTLIEIKKFNKGCQRKSCIWKYLYIMQMSEALKLQKAWGKKPCDHPHVEKEYALGMDTGDLVCTTCGRAVFDMHGNKIAPEPKKSKK